MMEQKTVLVAGGAGFLGSNLCARLLELNYRVTALDNFYTGSLSNLQPLMHDERFNLIKHDIVKPIDLPADIIINLACPASPPHYQRDPIFTTKTNVIGTLNLLELARQNKAIILQASTSEVYGDPAVSPQPESYRGSVSCTGIRACYDEGKRCAESLCFDFQRMYGTAIKIVRIFNTYGPNMDPLDGRVVSNFVLQALRGEPITIYGTGAQTRSFCYVSDLISGIIAMMESGPEITGPINLGNQDEFTMLELAHLVLALTKSRSEIIFMPLPQDDPQQRRPDITQARRFLGWEPQVALRDGLETTIAYFSSKLIKTASLVQSHSLGL